MKMIYLQYWPILLAVFTFFVVTTIFLEKKYFKMVRSYWFYKRSWLSYLSTAFFLMGIGLLIFSVLDLRGPEEKIKTQMPSERTIILLDTSASMLAEDVKPSRLQKAVLIAKHFARKAGGHQIAIVAFAEIQKKIVPFTSDLDLIDARLESLKNLRNHYGSSALTLALQESIQYFKETSDSTRGNILVLTDGEETAEGITLDIPKDVRIAFVGVGTTQGGRIPLDDGRGFRFGYKKNRGADVITKLNDEFFNRLVNDIPVAKYWRANSYDLPSEEVLDFFVVQKTQGDAQQDMVIRPVLMEWAVIPALVFLLLSYLFKFVRVFTLGLLLLISPSWSAQKEKQLSPQSVILLERLQKGELGHVEKLKLADDLYKSDQKSEALTLYSENLDIKRIDRNVPAEAYLNYGTALLEKGDTQKALATYDSLLGSMEKDDPKLQQLKAMIEKNIVTHFNQKKKQSQQSKDQKDKNQEDQKDQSGGQGQQNKPQQGSGQQNSTQNKSSGEQNDQQSQQKNKDKDQQKKSDQNNEDQKKDEGDKNQEPSTPSKPQPLKKLPAKLKQLMSDDRQLQMRIIENGTRDLNRNKSQRSKDW
jgi:Ca-activated chloride channel family protein